MSEMSLLEFVRQLQDLNQYNEEHGLFISAKTWKSLVRQIEGEADGESMAT